MSETVYEKAQALRVALADVLDAGVPPSLRAIFIRAAVELDGVLDSSDVHETRVLVIRSETLLEVLRKLDG